MTRARDLLLSNPGLFCRKSVARLLRRVPFLPRRVVRNIRGVRFECDFTLDPRVVDMFLSAYEPDEVAIVPEYFSRLESLPLRIPDTRSAPTEVAPGAYPLLGSGVADPFDYMARYGYAALDVERGARPVSVETLAATTNVLLVPERQ